MALARYNRWMKSFFPLLLLVLPFSAPLAQIMGEITSKPICGKLENRSDQTILGSISTAPQRVSMGDFVSHTENFKLEAGEKWDICTRGPFYPGQKLELTIRTLIPLFSCKTKIDQTVYLHAKPEQGGFTKLSATCR